jgi:hypothetical protein
VFQRSKPVFCECAAGSGGSGQATPRLLMLAAFGRCLFGLLQDNKRKPSHDNPNRTAAVSDRLFGPPCHVGPSHSDRIVGAHRSKIMFGVLVVVLCRDCIAILGHSTGQRQISLSARASARYRS